MARTKALKTAAPKKISETFLEFVAPLTSILGSAATDAELEQVLKIGCTVWNAVVLDAAAPGSRYVEEALRLAGQNEPVRMLIEQLVTNKRHHFKNDHRLIGEYQLYRDRGELRLRAEARSLNASLEQPATRD
jgi:hypothetical protein